MKKEKVLSYLNINNSTPNDKSMPQICFGFNVGVTVFILIFAILLFRPLNLCAYFLLGAWDIIYFIFLIRYHNPLWQIPLTAIGLLSLTIKLFFAYIITSKFEFSESQMPFFTWVHATVLVLSIGVIFYVWAKFYQAYKILKDNTLEVAKDKIAKKNPTPKWIALIALLSGSPMILVRLLRDDFNTLNLGLGFGMWTLGCIFIILFAMLLPKLIVLIRYQAWNFLEYHE